MVGLKQIALPGVAFTPTKALAAAALAAIQQGELGYAIVAGVKNK